MTALEVQNKQDEIKNSVSQENLDDATKFFTQLDNAKKNETIDEGWQSNYRFLVQEAFEKEWETVLNNIKVNLETEINKTDIDRNNQADQTVLAYTQALNAFETDLTAYYTQRQQKKDREKGNQNQTDEWGNLEYEFNLVQSIKKLITDKQTAVKKEENNKLDADGMFKTEPTPELATQLFNNSDPEIYNAMIAQIVGESEKPIEIKPAVWEDLSEEALKIWHLYKRIKTYMESVNIDMKDISDIKVGKPIGSFWWRYEKTDIQRVIQYTNQTKKDKDNVLEPQYIIHGSHEHLQEELAKANEDKELAPDKIIALDKKTRAERLNAFDNIGNYALFNKYLEIKWAEYVKANLTGILQAINVYTPSKRSIDEMDNQLNVFKNGYATTITDYVVAHSEELLESYTNQITESNLNIFGVDQQTRSANFNKLVKKRNDTGLRQRLPKAKQDELIRIKTKIENFDLPKTKEEAIKKWLDTIIDTFGPMLFNILKFFGIGKATLCKRFSGMEAKINGIFSKEYGLSSEQISAIDTISKKFSNNEEDLSLDTAQKIQKKFEKQKNTYIGLFLEKENYENLSVERIKAWFKAYYKANGESTTIDNIITIKKDKKTGKEYIDAITNKETFKGILWYLFDTEETRTEIHNANKEIQRPNKDNKTITEHNKSREDAARYIIKTDKDIARYLTASWFSTKDLAYVMTENSLHNGTEIQNSTPEPNKNEVLVFDEKYVDKTGKVIDQSKRIHEVIKMDNLPTNIKITKANGTVIEATLVTLADGIKTYVEKSKAKNQKLTIDDRVQIVLKDVISLPESKNVSQVRNDIKTILEKQESQDAQKEYEKKEYTSNEQNTYQKNIQTFWDLFEPIQRPYYDQLIAEKDNTTLKEIIEKNMVHIKNMFLNWWSIDGNLTKRDGNVIDIDKQDFTLKEAKDGKITITVTKKDANDASTKNGTIIFDKKEKEKYIQREPEVPTTTPAATTAATNTTPAAK